MTMPVYGYSLIETECRYSIAVAAWKYGMRDHVIRSIIARSSRWCGFQIGCLPWRLGGAAFGLTAALMLSTALPCAAEAPMILGPGSGPGSCGRWAAAAPDSGADYSFQSWVLGYISAVNIWAPGNNVTGVLPNVSVINWVRNWCQANPLAQVSTGANALLRTLNSSYSDYHPGQSSPDQVLPSRR